MAINLDQMTTETRNQKTMALDKHYQLSKRPFRRSVIHSRKMAACFISGQAPVADWAF